jgi:hypothetical protein
MSINFWGVVNGTMAFLPILKNTPHDEIARVVNIGSYASLIGLPNSIPYCSSKFALRGFTEALDIEL